LVEDVDKFPGHIACDGKSRSEIVVPVVQAGKVCFLLLLLHLLESVRDGAKNDLEGHEQSRTDLLTYSQVVAIIDVDCAELNGFTTEDQEALEALAELLAQSCDF
jgi:L-methionine (R)-S-oxide reductase